MIFNVAITVFITHVMYKEYLYMLYIYYILHKLHACNSDQHIMISCENMKYRMWVI